MLRDLDIAIDKDDSLLDQPPVDPSPLVSASTSKPGGDGVSRSIVDIATKVLRNYGKTPSSPEQRLHEEDDAHLVIADNLKQLALEPKEYRFFGKSSGAMLIQTAIELKNEYTGRPSPKPAFGLLGLKRNEFWTSHPVRLSPVIRYISPDTLVFKKSGKMA